MRRKMRLAVVGLHAIGLIGACSALPIQSANTGDRNVVLLGALMFLSFGAVIAGCVCCRRRKKGFEEFRNESGTPDANKTEYPIFRALSPEAQRHAAPIVVPPVSNSNENLIEEEFDNNNGPISPADLENIENNNAVDYIRNQNEVGVDIEPSSYTINRNLVNAATARSADDSESSVESSPSAIPLDELQDIHITITSPCLETEHHEPHSLSGEVPLEDIIIESYRNFTTENGIDNYITVDEELAVYKIHDTSLEECPKASINIEQDLQTYNATEYSDVECQESSQVKLFSCATRNATWGENQICVDEEINESTTPDEALSIKSSSSDKSGEINSVEEALRALDCAIAEENSLHSGDDDEYDSTGEGFECDNANFQNVLRQLLISDSVKRFLPGLNDDQLNDYVSNDHLEGVRTEAELLVDSILNESRKIIENQEKSFNDQTVVIQNCELNDSSTLAKVDSFENIKSEPCTLSPVTLTPSGSVEDFLSHLDSTSTPFVQKHTSHKLSGFPILQDEIPGIKLRKPHIVEEDQLINPSGDKNLEEVLSTTQQAVTGSTAADGTFLFRKCELNTCDQTFEVDKTFDVQQIQVDDLGNEYTHPGDPCTSKQALARDSYPTIVLDHEEVHSGDMTTVTPVNTPIEPNYSNEMWHALTKGAEMTENFDSEGAAVNDDNGFASNGWFLHPQGSNLQANETYDVDEEEDEANLESTFEALRKQLAEVLPQPQGITGPAEYSDDEDDVPQNRTFDEYRSPLDATVVSLLEGDPTPGTTVQNEMFINYKRLLTPILEESEEETCKTFVMNETKCLDSTSTGCVDTGEAIMGVSKALMASNDTLFNFEDTLGEREEVFSPRTPSRTEVHMNLSGKSGKSTEENSTTTLESEKPDSNNSERGFEGEQRDIHRKRSPPTTIDIPTSFEIMVDSDVCSPEQQKTFSEGTNSSNTDRVSSDVSATVDHDTTFTTYTNDEKTCVTVIIKDDERISEISEPEWGSTASYGGYEMNSLTDIPSLDYNVNNDAKSAHTDESSNSSDVTSKNSSLNGNAASPIYVYINPSVEDNQQDDSGNSTHMSADDRTTNSEPSIEDETQKCENSMSCTVLHAGNDLRNQSQSNPSKSKSVHDSNLDDREKCRNFLQCEIAMSSSQSQNYDKHIHKAMPFIDILPNGGKQDMEDYGDFDSSKENKNPNIKAKQQQQQQLNISPNSIDFDKQISSTISYPKVQTNSQDAVIVDKITKFNAKEHSYENMDLMNGEVQENIFYKPETTILPNKHHQQTIINYNVSDMSVNGEHIEPHCLMVADEIIAHLSGEEDPWAEPLHNDIQFTGPCSEIITSFTNEWDSDVDDSHSSEEFMYVRGTPTKEKISEIIGNETGRVNKSSNDHDFFEYAGLNETDVWSTHEDKVPVADSAEDDISEGSSSEFEGEFVPSCWDSMATPARSALKSPDKSSSQPSKKRRSVAFKKQRYHSVYEYPRETVSLSPSYSEPYLCRKNRGSLYYDRDSKEEFDDGFTVSSSMRPFHGSQFNALCHTWPTDSDFSWSQVEDLGELSENKKLTSYSTTISGKWPQNFDSIDLTDGDAQTENLEYFSTNRPDSGVGESAEMLSDRLPLGELCHTRSRLRLPLDLLPPVESASDTRPEPTKLSETILVDRLILPTPSCTGSMDSISSSSGSERQVSFSTFGKSSHNPSSLNVEPNENRRPGCNVTAISSTDHLKPALILIENGPIEFSLGSDKIKQSDSTDEDSGIESIMKVNKESD